MQRYHHRQTNRNTLVIFISIAVVVTVCWMLFMPAKVPLAALAGPLALTAAVVAVVSTFTIDVTDRELVLAFGLGLFRRRVPLTSSGSSAPRCRGGTASASRSARHT